MKKRLHFRVRRIIEISEMNLTMMRSGRMSRESLIAEVIDTCGRVLRDEMKGKTKREIFELVNELIVG